MEGVIVTKDFDYELMVPDDLSAYTPLHVAGLCQRLHVPFAARPRVLTAVLERIFADVVIISETDPGC